MKKKTMLIAGNWKMNLSNPKAENLLKDICLSIPQKIKKNAMPLQNTSKSLTNGFSLLVAPSHLSVMPCYTLAKALMPMLNIASQDLHFTEEGAYTGKVSASMLAESGIKTCLVGHSETRKHFNESDESVNKKIISLQKHRMVAIVCVGETLEQRENKEVEGVIKQQIVNGLKGVNLEQVVIAYEPVWAIGTGKTATPQQAEEVHAFIKKTTTQFNPQKTPPILYGGSVNEKNAQAILEMPSIDGALVGGASLKPASFAAIAQAGFNLLH